MIAPDNQDLLVLSILLTQVDETIGTFHEVDDMERSFIPADQIEESLFKLARLNLISNSMVSGMDEPVPDGDLISLTPRGLAYCLAHEARILTAALGGSTQHISEVRQAYERLREDRGLGLDSSEWTGLTERLGPETVAQIRAGASVLLQVVEQSDLNPRDKQNALACARAIQELVNAPDPPWKQVVELLTSKPLTAFLNVANLLALILQMAL